MARPGLTSGCADDSGSRLKPSSKVGTLREALPGEPIMGIAERIYEIAKELPEATAAEVLEFAETRRCTAAAKTAEEAHRAAALALLDKHTGRFKAVKFNRAELYDRAGLR